MSISDRQRAMLAFIENFLEEKGYPPTYEEIRAGLNFSTKSLVNYHLEALENAALLSRVPNTPRGLRLPGSAETLRVPLINKVNSDPAETREANKTDESEVIQLTSDIVPDGRNLYAVKVYGDAMIDALVNDGDIVIMQPQTEAQNGELVAVHLVERNETMLKRFYRENGHVRLQPANPTLEPTFVKPDAVKVQGKVVAIIRQVN